MCRVKLVENTVKFKTNPTIITSAKLIDFLRLQLLFFLPSENA